MKTGIRLGMGALGIVALVGLGSLVLAPEAFAQDGSWTSDSGNRETRDRTRSRSGSSHVRGYDEYGGPYVQFGATVGAIDFDGPIDSDAGGGITITGGYRVLSWLSAEANVTYLGGGDVEFRNTDIGEGEFFAFTFGPKFYPVAAFEDAPIPEFFQPYALIGIGGGEFEIDGRNNTGREQSSFIARFMFGFDVWVTDHIGAFVEGGYHAASDDDVDGAGIFAVGGQYRF